MNPGEYVGKDGRTYRWIHGKGGYGHWIFDCGYRPHPLVDTHAAKAALDALVESENGEWVYWECSELQYRAKPDGSRVEYLNSRGEWCGSCGDTEEVSYRKGREVALAERQEELDAKSREITALRSVCASINILMQERGLEGMGGKNYALLFGVVQTYINQLEAPLVESAVLRDAARELVEAVGGYRDLLDRGQWNRILAAAKTLEGKL